MPILVASIVSLVVLVPCHGLCARAVAVPIAINASELRPGMVVTRSVRNRYTVLISVNSTLTTASIRRLQELDPDELIYVADPLLDKRVDFADDSDDYEMACTVHRHVVGAMEGIHQKLGHQADLTPGDVSGLKKAMADVLGLLRQQPVASAYLIKTKSADEYLHTHVANVFYLSMLLARQIQTYVAQERQRMSAGSDYRVFMDLEPLGLGALLHDVGMLPLVKLYHTSGELSAGQMDDIRRHPTIGAERLPQTIPPAARHIVRHHHENMDGSGYPDGLRGASLHVFTRVIRIADAFDAGTSATVYREAKSMARLLWEISAGPYRHHYDPAIVKVFLGLVQPFTIGMRLQLSDGTYGVVVRHNRQHPFAPVVIVAFDEKGRRLPDPAIGRPIDLAGQTGLRIIGQGRERLTYVHTVSGDLITSKPHDASRLFAMVYP